jgi:hypothetical protein
VAEFMGRNETIPSMKVGSFLNWIYFLFMTVADARVIPTILFCCSIQSYVVKASKLDT